jgi:hypothetical protein
VKIVRVYHITVPTLYCALDISTVCSSLFPSSQAALDLASHAERERHRAEERERARKTAEQTTDVIPDASTATERDDLLSQVCDGVRGGSIVCRVL